MPGTESSGAHEPRSRFLTYGFIGVGIAILSAWVAAHLPISDFGQSNPVGIKVEERLYVTLLTVVFVILQGSQEKGGWIARGFLGLVFASFGLFRLIRTASATGSILSGLLDAAKGYGGLWRQFVLALVVGLLYRWVAKWVNHARESDAGEPPV